MESPRARAAAFLAGVPSFVWDGAALPVPVEDIADSHVGLLVRDVPSLRMASIPGAPGGASLSGLLLVGPGQIWVNAEEAAEWPGRRRFTIGHELGHWQLHRARMTVFCRTAAVAGEEDRAVLPDIEEEASLFASALLFPPDLVRRHYARLDGDVGALCELFAGSRAATERAICDAVRRPIADALAGAARFFHLDDAGYEAWREAHREEGYVLNDGLGGADTSRLHRARCSYLDRAVQEGSPRTRQPKWCALDPAVLRAALPARDCGRCRP